MKRIRAALLLSALPTRWRMAACHLTGEHRKTACMTKPEHIGLITLGGIITAICIFAGATLGWKARIALVLLTIGTLFVWLAPEATGTAIIHLRTVITYRLKTMR